MQRISKNRMHSLLIFNIFGCWTIVYFSWCRYCLKDSVPLPFCLFYLWKQIIYSSYSFFYFLHDIIFCFHLLCLYFPRIWLAACGDTGFSGLLWLVHSPRSRIPSFSFPLLSCILQVLFLTPVLVSWLRRLAPGTLYYHCHSCWALAKF